MIATQAFGNTGHQSSRILFGAAALARMRQERADAVLELLLEFGINHLDTAASYGESELRLRPWLAKFRDRFFLATKTGERTYDGARASIERSRERLGADTLDLIQLHNLVNEDEWQTALGPGGALEAALEARSRGEVRFIGVTGHGTQAPSMHLRSLERHAFDSVLAPWNFTMAEQPEYRESFERLRVTCAERGVALQTIKSIARRRWQPDFEGTRFSWYEPIRDPAALRRAVYFVLALEGSFLNSSSDASLLRPTLEAAAEWSASETALEPLRDELEQDVRQQALEPLFEAGRDAI